MIPTLLLAGLPIGLLPRWWPVVGVLIAGIGWTILFAVDDLLSGPVDAIFVFAFGVANLAGGAFIAWLVKRLIVVAIGEWNR